MASITAKMVHLSVVRVGRRNQLSCLRLRDCSCQRGSGNESRDRPTSMKITEAIFLFFSFLNLKTLVRGALAIPVTSLPHHMLLDSARKRFGRKILSEVSLQKLFRLKFY